MVACGAGKPVPTPAASSPGPTVTVPFELPVVISIAGHFDEAALALVDRQIAAFEEENPDVKVEVVRAPRLKDKRRETFASALTNKDNSVDIYVVDPSWLSEFASGGWLVPLDAFAASTGNLVDRFPLWQVQANTVAGFLLGLPWGHGQSLALSAFSLQPDRSLRLMAALLTER
jgi:ABC-type glycerol-3-phosphate transport system substrate-binding protein